MKLRRALPALLLLCLPATPARAHRIDEYLQATILSLAGDHLEATMRLVPGTLIAPDLITAIDSNGDGTISTGEGRAYAQRVVDDLSLTLDGQQLHPRLIRYSFPPPAQMREGLGQIQLVYQAPYASGAPPSSAAPARHRLVLVNHHRSGTSVYLVNAEIPASPVRILAQSRNAMQSSYTLDFEAGPAASSHPWYAFPPSHLALWLLLAALAVCLVSAASVHRLRAPRNAVRSQPT